jgi:hypothetical protein
MNTKVRTRERSIVGETEFVEHELHRMARVDVGLEPHQASLVVLAWDSPDEIAELDEVSEAVDCW